MTITTSTDDGTDRFVCDDCGRDWRAAASADITCTCGSANLHIPQIDDVGRILLTRSVPNWLRLEEVVPTDLQADLADLHGLMLALVDALEVFVADAGDIRRRYEQATDGVDDRFDIHEGLDRVTGFDRIQELEKIVETVIEAQVDPGNISWSIDSAQESARRVLSPDSPIIGFFERANAEIERRRARSEAIYDALIADPKRFLG